ncbi:class I SAM-dependent methyltransferase [Phyllobacterium myrsinacearum]|uniref:Ubiquinone/menaquinone biosynthesis C-methylase UbiE n=1 Tax=Phyllobacterium myrsinacearum TaxID=28101 RepID=A0A839EL73_9HYPH|nr:class I SAM-dependent methyltransferase [Phyllobacterium myrsinacearum]MBA8878224.1 ubiquinone/menaquinone biosynthesis C-methylase UbiE [Phyllobacterium myrsinacearum]
MLDDIYTNGDLPALYDVLNPAREDTAFYIRVAGRPKRILDIGCGTGLLACMLAEHGHTVTGVEPARAMLDIARNRQGSEAVTWIEGDARALDLSLTFDLIVMTGHVFQVFLTDDDIRAVLKTAYAHLAKGGCLIFESRNPAVKAWESWVPEKTAQTVSIAGVGDVGVQHRLIAVRGDLVVFETDHYFHRTRETLVNRSVLRFLPQAEIETQLRDAGLTRTTWYGDWSEGPVNAESSELIVVAERD